MSDFRNMKKSFCFLLVTLVFIKSILAGTQSADYYLNTPEKYLGKKITLYTAYVGREGSIDNVNGVIFQAYTIGYNDEFDTSITYVLVPNEKADTFARRYGHKLNFNGSMGKIKRLPMTCVLKKAGDKFYFSLE